jgi:hypothetical protein
MKVIKKGGKTMKYETPELTALAPATNAVQSGSKPAHEAFDGIVDNEASGTYQDWE